uniref:NADH dehydrogenase subunit 6 n=1 Tax=Hackeriella veitchi TaxID=60873 RepID=L7N6K5_9HEMI|nr:NADH dehydrogenase subunit 6 [Hackeriella veitchi]ACV96710.1 NADH dehydrogenase subunit 6 [Hackeriella veitchi]
MIKLMLTTCHMTLSTNFMFTTHPLIMGYILLLQTVITCLLVNYIQSSNWIAFVTFSLIMGNMLIMFLYVVSLASNEVIKSTSFMPHMKSLLLMIMLVMMPGVWIKTHSLEMINNSLTLQLPVVETNLLAKMFYHNSSTLVIILMLMLFFSLCSTALLTTIHEGPMRPMN